MPQLPQQPEAALPVPPDLGPEGAVLPGPQDTPEGRKMDLGRDLANLDRKNEKAKEKDKLSRHEIRKLKMEVLGQVFESMQKLGVDPNDLGSIREFLDTLEQMDPDLAFLFSDAFKGLDPDAGMDPADLEPGADADLPGEGPEKFAGLREALSGGSPAGPPGLGAPPPGLPTGPPPNFTGGATAGAPPPGIPTGPPPGIPQIPPGL